MSARAEKIVPAKRVKVEEVIIGFDAEKLKAPFLLRCGALMVDYILVVTIPVASLLLGRLMGNDGAKLLNSEISNVGWLIVVLVALTNFVIFPLFSGQSIGKMIAGLRIVKLDGKMPRLGSIALRHFVGYPLTLLTGGLGYLISIFSAKGRALHDYFGGTVVVYGRSEFTKKNNEKSGKRKQR